MRMEEPHHVKGRAGPRTACLRPSGGSEPEPLSHVGRRSAMLGNVSGPLIDSTPSVSGGARRGSARLLRRSPIKAESVREWTQWATFLSERSMDQPCEHVKDLTLN